MTKLVISLILGFSSLASAATLDIRSQNASKMVVDKDRGGGNAVNGQLFDFYENEGTVALKVVDHVVYKDYISPIFKRIEARLPGFTTYMLASTKTKQWYLEPKEIAAEDCVNSSMIKAEKSILACQSEFEVRINSRWFADMLNKSPQQAAALIVHELLVAKVLESNASNPGYIKEESVRYINRLIFSNALPEAEELRDILSSRNFKSFDTAAEVASMQADMNTAIANVRAEVQKVCPTDRKNLSVRDMSDLVVRTNEKSMSWNYPMMQRAQFLQLGKSLYAALERSNDLTCANVRKLAASWKPLNIE